MYGVVVHGGAGAWEDARRQAALQGVREAAEDGRRILAQGGAALDAVVAAVVRMEDMPVFNAGTGSALNLDGEAEMDAGVMDGEGLLSGNVSCLRRVRNPVLVARKVMEETGHVLLAREGALRFARAMGFTDHDPVTPERLADWRAKRDALKRGEGSFPARLRVLLENQGESGTVGAIALDQGGRLAAAASTGGLTLKLAGRVGDTPVPGAGNYATSACAASATGRGELMMRFLTTRVVCDKVAAGQPPQEAVEDVLAEMARSVGSEVGIIALDRSGRWGVAHLTPAMVFAVAREDEATIAEMGLEGALG